MVIDGVQAQTCASSISHFALEIQCDEMAAAIRAFDLPKPLRAASDPSADLTTSCWRSDRS